MAFAKQLVAVASRDVVRFYCFFFKKKNTNIAVLGYSLSLWGAEISPHI